jgi:hypothetical protein
MKKGLIGRLQLGDKSKLKSTDTKIYEKYVFSCEGWGNEVRERGGIFTNTSSFREEFFD